MTKRLLIVMIAAVSIFTSSAILIMTNTSRAGNLEVEKETNAEIIVETTLYTIEIETSTTETTTNIESSAEATTILIETTAPEVTTEETTTVEETNGQATTELQTTKKPTNEKPTTEKEEKTTSKKEEKTTTYPTLSTQYEDNSAIGSNNMNLIRNTIYSGISSTKSLNATSTLKNVAIYCAKYGSSATSVGEKYGLGTIKGTSVTVYAPSAEAEDISSAATSAWNSLKSKYKTISSNAKEVGVGINVSYTNGKYKIIIYIACK